MQTPAKLIWIPFLAFFLFFVPDMIGYSQWTWKAKSITNYAIEHMSAGGGWTPLVEKQVTDRMSQLGLKPGQWTVTHTEGIVRSPGLVQFSISSKYRVSAFGMIGEKMNNALGESTILRIHDDATSVSQIN